MVKGNTIGKVHKASGLVRAIALLLVCAILVTSIPMETFAAPKKTFSIAEAESLALAYSKPYKRIRTKISTAITKYTGAVASIKMKERRLRTFSWKPLISFKLPQTPSYTEEYEFRYKPLQLQSTINSLRHELFDKWFDVKEEIDNLYVKIYTEQETIAYNEDRLKELETTLKRNKAKLVTGEAKQSDIDSIEKSIDALKTKLSNTKKSFENDKKTLYEKTKRDVRSGYIFLQPYKDADIPRSALQDMIDYTIDNCQEVTDARLQEALAKASMSTYFNIIVSKYGGVALNYLMSYYIKAIMGQEIDEERFESAVKRLLDRVNSPWEGGFKILFWKLKYSWFQGETDGRNYVEDEPYAIYNATLDYVDARETTEQTIKNVAKNVEESYETLMNLRSAYQNLVKTGEKEADEVAKQFVLNSIGELEFSEYKDTLDSYEDTQLSIQEALDSYTQALNSLDRTTIGFVSAYLKGELNDMETAFGGSSFLIKEVAEGVSYYINLYIEKSVFELGIYVPDDYELDVTDFELWVDGVQIGERTKVSKVLRHLELTTENYEKCFLRFYNGTKFVDDVEIDPSVLYSEIEITKGYHVKKEEDRRIGTFLFTKGDVENMYQFTFTPDDKHKDEIYYYLLRDQYGKDLYTDGYIAAGTPMPYLDIVKESLNSVTLVLFNDEYGELYEAYLDEDSYEAYMK